MSNEDLIELSVFRDLAAGRKPTSALTVYKAIEREKSVMRVLKGQGTSR